MSDLEFQSAMAKVLVLSGGSAPAVTAEIQRRTEAMTAASMVTTRRTSAPPHLAAMLSMIDDLTAGRWPV